jgi:hypothetical protein
MLVPQMALSEIRKEIELDYPSIKRKITAMSEAALKQMRKTKMTHFHKSMDYVSPRKNNWIIGFTYRQPAREHGNVHYMAIMPRPSGFTVFYPPPGEKIILLYTSHFFKRYDERLGLNLVEPKEKIRHFILHAGSAPYEKLFDIGPDKFSFFAVNNVGVMLGVHYKNENIAKFNTFITHDMLRGTQVERYDKLKQLADKYTALPLLD